MMYQVYYVAEGRPFTTPSMDENSKNMFIEHLSNSGIEFSILERGDKKWHCVKVVFDMQKIEEGLKAVANGTADNMDWIYTFGDPTEKAKVKNVVGVECTNGQERIAYVVDVWLATAKEIKDFKTKIRYPKLGIVKKVI